jgi:hypothetical protein
MMMPTLTMEEEEDEEEEEDRMDDAGLNATQD